MAKSYHHLTRDERCQIYALLAIGVSLRTIAKQMGRDVSTISREVSRNSGGRGYRPAQAQRLSEDRRRAASSESRKMHAGKWHLVEALLEFRYSPEQLSGLCGLLGIAMAGHTWIYVYVRADRHRGGTLYKFLRRRGKKRNWVKGKHAGRGHIPNRVDISERPAIVERKSRTATWRETRLLALAILAAWLRLLTAARSTFGFAVLRT